MALQAPQGVGQVPLWSEVLLPTPWWVGKRQLGHQRGWSPFLPRLVLFRVKLQQCGVNKRCWNPQMQLWAEGTSE